MRRLPTITLTMDIGILAMTSCKSKTVYLPVETVRTEYKDVLTKDSVYRIDSVFVKAKGDTIWYEKYKYLYRDKLIRDSVYLTDTVQIPYPIKGDTQYINHLYWWQQLLILAGALSLGFILYRIYIKAKKLML